MPTVTQLPIDPPTSASPLHEGAPSPADWLALLAQVGEEVAAPLTAALERVNALAATGHIDAASVRALRDEVEAARKAGKLGQQLARFASGRVRQSHEQLHLTQLLTEVVLQRGRELHARGITLRQSLAQAEVVADAPLLFAMLNALFDWAGEHARSAVDLRLELTSWPVQARLQLRFVHLPTGDLAADEPMPQLDSLAWRLVEHSGWVMGLLVEREEHGIETRVVITFPRTLPPDLGEAAPPLDAGAPSSMNSQPLAGSHVLVVASRREVRQQVREAIAAMGLILDFVPSLAEARQFCSDALPHAIVYEAPLGGERFSRWRDELRQESPGLVFVELLEEGDLLETTGSHGGVVARVGRGALRSGLPAALVFELGVRAG